LEEKLLFSVLLSISLLLFYAVFGLIFNFKCYT